MSGAGFSFAGGGGNPYVMGASMALQAFDEGINAYYTSKIAKAQYQLAATQAKNSAAIARMNAELSAMTLLTNQARIENQAALEGFQAGQEMAATRVSQAGSGVYMNSASSYEVRASQRFARAVDMANTEINRVTQLTADMATISNYQAQAIGYEGEARANQILADSINPRRNFFGSVLTNALSGFGNSVASGSFDKIGANQFSTSMAQTSSKIPAHTNFGAH